MNLMKYFLLDVAIIMSLVIAAKHLLRYADGASSVLMAQEQECDDAANSTNRTKLPRQQERQHQYEITSDIPSNNDDTNHLKIGSIVELYTDESYFSAPAIITGFQEEKSSAYYILQNIFTDTRIPRVDPEFVHPYQVYEDGTRASCNVGALRTIVMTPCAIVSHSIRKSGSALYQVSYLDKEEILVHDYLPFSRVQRVHGRGNGSRVT